MRWQPVPRAPLVPNPLSIKESWDPLFRQPPLSQQALNQRSTGKSPLAKQSPSSWDCRTKSSGSSGTQRNQGSNQGSPRLDGAVDQALTCIEARGGAPHTPEDRKPPAVEATPRPLPKTDTFPVPSAPLVAWANPSKAPLPLLSQPQSGPPKKLYSPSAFAYPTPFPQWTTLTPIREDRERSPPMAHTDVGMGTSKSTDVPHGSEVLLFLLMNMKDVAGAWAHPHLNQLGSHRALIQTVDEFRTEFLAAFGNPDATQAAEQQITQLTQTGTCAEYITKFRTIAMDLDWNNAALCGQFAHGLHWELQNAALVIDNALREERTSHPPKGNKSGNSSTPNRGASTGQQATRPGHLSSDPNFVSKRNKTAAGLKASASSAEEGVKKEAAKIGKESGPKLGKD
ncbi:hypothetical protein RHS01_10548 [Rhizoctonia solani]|uniref:Retrotransposon gag domain-containing protein n=1 Tax=Rhizoctonia solani TaxID=456999 RepID=A0A8H7LZU3_9AGAM|nr:hypothetical protein RHS01_10548 [Rhizoctonia solani]